MKKYFSLIAFAMLAVFSLAFVSCGDDDDELDPSNKNGNGKVSVAYENAITAKYSVVEATFLMWSQEVIGTTHISYNDGATFNVVFNDGNYSYTYWQFQTHDEIKKGANLTINGVFFDYDPRHTDETEGDAIVKSVSKDKITLSFKNFSFERYANNNSRQKITINGEITFTLDD